MPIYTKTGDDGTTALFGGERVSKADARIEAGGQIDELTSFLGWASLPLDSDMQVFLTEVQKDLYLVMAVIAGSKQSVVVLNSRAVEFETKIDKMEKALPKLNRFILPGGSEASSRLHIVRGVCRRAERSVVVVYAKDLKGNGEHIVQYMNRLSDFLFTLARWYNKGREFIT